LALGVIAAADRLGLSIPRDVALVGFDDIWVSGIPGVSLTSVSSKGRRVGQMSARMLCQQMARQSKPGAATGQPQRVLLTPELIVRRSCGC